jgi:hypothetical protein
VKQQQREVRREKGRGREGEEGREEREKGGPDLRRGVGEELEEGWEKGGEVGGEEMRVKEEKLAEAKEGVWSEKAWREEATLAIDTTGVRSRTREMEDTFSDASIVVLRVDKELFKRLVTFSDGLSRRLVDRYRLGWKNDGWMTRERNGLGWASSSRRFECR